MRAPDFALVGVGPHYVCKDDWLTSCIQIDDGSVAQVVHGPHVEGGRTAARASI